jgi:hypothetical protein
MLVDQRFCIECGIVLDWQNAGRASAVLQAECQATPSLHPAPLTLRSWSGHRVLHVCL